VKNISWPEALLTLVIGGGLGAKLFEWATGRRRARADVADTMTDAAESNVRTMVAIVGELKEQVVALRNQNQALVLESGNLRLEVGNLRKENADLRQIVEMLRDEVRDLKRTQDDGR
jgi:regulator of replication initiation timing